VTLPRPSARNITIAFVPILSAFFGLRGYLGSTSADLPQPQLTAASAPAPTLDTIPIEQIRVGQRVLTGAADPDKPLPTAVDEQTWRHLTLEETDTWPDGTIDRICVESLMPPDWLAFHDGAPVGSRVPIPLDLEEMGLPEGMTAWVTADEPCPEISTGPGRVVLTTVNHLNPSVVELTLRPVASQYSLPSEARGRAGEGADAGHVLPSNGNRPHPVTSTPLATNGSEPLQPSGSSNQETVRPTAFHKFYSETRDQWLSAEDLQPGETLRGLTGPLQVVSQRPIPGTHRVYNMTVEGEHVYHVSTLGVLAHNMCARVAPEIEVASSSRIASEQWYIYRVLDEADDINVGLVGKSDAAKYGDLWDDLAYHVRYGSSPGVKTPVISGTADIGIAEGLARRSIAEYGGTRSIVRIDLSATGARIVDLRVGGLSSRSSKGFAKIADKYAIGWQEISILDRVDSRAIQLFKTVE
jgi:hypothetical protein